MSDSVQANSGDNQTRETKKSKSNLVTAVVLGSLVLYAILIVVAIWHPGLQGQRLKFGTENGLTLAIVIAVIIQVVINREQWNVMERQSQVMLHGIRPIVEVRAVFQPSGDINFVISNIGRIPAIVRFTYRCTLGTNQTVCEGRIEGVEVGHNQVERTVPSTASKEEIEGSIITGLTPLKIEITGDYRWELGSYPIKLCKLYGPQSRVFSIDC